MFRPYLQTIALLLFLSCGSGGGSDLSSLAVLGLGGGSPPPGDAQYEIVEAPAFLFTGETGTIRVRSSDPSVDRAIQIRATEFLPPDGKIAGYNRLAGEFTFRAGQATQQFSVTLPCRFGDYPGYAYIGVVGVAGTRIQIAQGVGCSGSATKLRAVMGVVPARATIGSMLNFEIYVSAGAAASARSCTVRYGTSTSLYSGSPSLGTITVQPQSGVQSFSLSVPGGWVSRQNYYLSLFGDGSRGCAGSDFFTSSRLVSSPVEVFATGVYPLELRAPANAQVDSALGFTVDVYAVGSPGAMTCGVYLSTDSSISIVDFHLGDVALSDSSEEQTFSVTIPLSFMTRLASTSSFYLGMRSSTFSNCQSVGDQRVSIAPAAATSVTSSGTIQFERPATNASTYQLNPSSLTNLAAPGVTVQMLNYDNAVLASTVTDAAGSYSLSGPVNGFFRIRAIAELKRGGSPAWDLEVRNSTSSAPGSVYSLQSSEVYTDSGPAYTVDLTGVDSNRGNGPFAILAAMKIAIDKLLLVNPALNLPELDIKWTSAGTVGSFFTRSSATCGVAPNCIVIKGNRFSDSDEFDWHVVTHEFTHFLEATQSRSDSIGGGHSFNDLLDPRVAYGEGLGNAMGAIFLDDPAYVDTAAGSGGFGFNVETGTHTLKGYYSEFSVQSIIWDLYDSANEGADTLSLGFAPIWSAALGLRDIEGITWLPAFSDTLKAARPADVAGINSILGMENVATSIPGEADVSAVVSGVYTGAGIAGHTCDGSTAAYAYNPILQTVSGTGANAYSGTHRGSQYCGAVAPGLNKLFGSQFFLVTPGSSGSLTVRVTDTSASDADDPDVGVYDRGALIASGATAGGETVTATVAGGRTYVVEIRTYSRCMDLYRQGSACSASISSISGENEYDVNIDLP